LLYLKHEKDIPEAFNLTQLETDMLVELIAQVAETNGDLAKVTWALERLWIDERFSDNLRVYAIFKLGYAYALQNEGR
jgi:hypothetical protein